MQKGENFRRIIVLCDLWKMFDEYMSIILNYARVRYESKNDVRSRGGGVLFQLALHEIHNIQRF